MLNSIDFTGNKDKIAIVVVGYNRLKSIGRLLDSLLNAVYTSQDVPLVISIDGSGDTALYGFVQDFDWPYGHKYVNIEENRLGLLNHIYQCGDLTKFFKAIILLEDDLVVSPYFYSYIQKVLPQYINEDRIAELSLYKNERNGYVGLPFINEQNGLDVFLMQDVSTWGQCWTSQMWNSFCLWRDSHTEADVLRVDMPKQIKGWTRAWSKYYNAYVVDTDRYVLYPNISLTTNFSDAGVHGGDNNSIVQVNLLQKDLEYRMADFGQLVKYDIYFNNLSLLKWLDVTPENVTLDVYGFQRESTKHYILSTRKLPYKILRTFALNMRPIELNVKYDIKGKGLYLYDTQEGGEGNGDYSEQVVPYFLEGFSPRLLLTYIAKLIKTVFLRKVGLK